MTNYLFKQLFRCSIWLLLGFVSTNTFAQVSMTRSIFYDPINPISTGTGATLSTALGDDAIQTAIPIGFTFTYLGTGYTNIAACTNGWASFTATAQSAANNNLFATAAPNATLAPWFDDLFSDSILYQTQGPPGAQTFTIQWHNQSYWNNTGRPIIYQLVLLEATGEIEFYYEAAPTTGTVNTNESASIGIESVTGGPLQFIDAVSGSSAIGNSTLQSNRWPQYNFRFTPGAPTAIAGGSYTVGGGQVFPTFNEAAAELNHRGITGPVTLNLTDAVYDTTTNFFPILFGPITTATNTLTITKSGAPAVISYRGSSAGNIANSASSTSLSSTTEPIIGLIGTDFVTISNLIIESPNLGVADRGISLSNVTAIDGAQNNIFQNITVNMNRANTNSRGFASSVPTTPTATTGTNSNNIFRNFTITNTNSGIVLIGNATLPDVNNIITNSVCTNFNTIGDPNIPNDIGNTATAPIGISMQNQSGFTVSNNRISNVTNTGGQADGISIVAFQGTNFLNNNIVRNIRNAGTASTTAVSGIRATHTTTGTHALNIYNNAVSDIFSSYTGAASATRAIKGIFIAGTGGATTQTYNIFNNSVSIDGSSSLNLSSVCYEISTSSGPVYNVGNNIFANFTAAQTGVARHIAVYTTSATSFGNTGTVSNNNDLFVLNDVGTTGFVGIGNTTGYATLANWTTATTQDAASISLNPNFFNNSNDLRAGNLLLNGAGRTYPAYLTQDLNCAPRVPDNDLGAYIINACSGSPAAGTITGLNNICSGNSTTLTLNGASTAAGVIYQWASSTTSGGPYTNMGTSLTQATGPLSTPTYYVVSVTCSVSGLTTVTTEKAVNIDAIPTISVTPSTALNCLPSGTSNLTVSGSSVSYVWSPSAGLSATTGTAVTANPPSTTVYTVVGTGANGCTASTTANVNVFATPVINSVTANPANLCVGGNSQLNVTTATFPVSSYLYSVSSSGTLQNMTGATQLLGANNDDNVMAAPTNIGFNFNFDGTTYTQFSASPDGWILLGGATAVNDFSNQVTDPTNIPKIYPYWDDVATGTNGYVQSLLVGTAPNRILVVEWFVTIPRATAGAANSTMQLWIYEADGKIEFHYGTMGAGAMTASVGLTASTTNYLSVNVGTGIASNTTTTDNNAGQPSNGTVYTFASPTLSYSWSPATFLSATNIANPIAQSVQNSISYSVTANSNGCIDVDSVSISTGIPLSSSVSSTITTPVCANTNVTLQATPIGGGGPYSYAWSGPLAYTSTLQNPVLSATTNTVASSGTYTVTITDNCGVTVSGSTNITFEPIPSISIAASNPTYCLPGGTAVNLTASGADTYVWSPATGLSATTGNTTDATPTGTTLYTVVGTSAANGCTSSATSNVLVAPAVSIDTIFANPANICVGGNTQLQVTPNSLPVSGYTFTAGTGTTLDPMTGATQLIGTSVDDTPMAAPTNIGFTFNFNGTAYTQFSASPDGWILLGNTPATSDFTNDVADVTNNPKIYPYWDDVATGTNGNVTYLLTGTAPNRIMIIQWFVTVPRNTTGAANSTFQAWLYEADGRIEFRYGTMAAGAMSSSVGLTGSPTNFNCVTIATNSNSFNTVNNANAGQPANGTIYTFAPPAFNYNWSPATYLSSTSVANPSATGVANSTTYFVSVSANGCSVQDSVVVTAGLAFSASATTGPNTTVCAASNVTLQANPIGGGGPYNYAWSGPNAFSSSLQNPVLSSVTLTTGGTYTVTITDNCGSTATATTSLTVEPIPSVSSVATNSTYCTPGGTAISITASGADSYSWSPSTGLSATTGTTVDATPSGTTVYTVVGTSAANGCTASTTTTVTVAPAVSILSTTATPSTICNGGSSQLQVNPNSLPISGYVFSSGTGTTLDPMTGATTVVPANIDDTPMAAPANIGFTFNFNGSAYTQYSVSPDGWILLGGALAVSQFTNDVISTTNVPKIYPYWDDMTTGTNGGVQVLLTGTAPNQILIFQWSTTIPYNISATANTTFQAWLYEADGKIEFRYGTMGASTMSSSVGLTGSATNYNCVTIATNSNSFNTVNNANAGQPANGTIYTFTPPTFTYNWSPATLLGSSSIANPLASGVSSSTTFTVTVSANGCSANSNVAVNVTTPNTAATVTDAVCTAANGSISVTSTDGTAPYTYLWSNASTNANVTGLTAGSYTVTTTDANGCQGTTTVTVAATSGTLSSSTSVTSATCLAADGTATATANGGTAPYTYNWSNSQNSVVATGLSSGSYDVTIVDASGCISTSNAVVTANAGNLASAITTADEICTSSNGSASVTANGGTAPYTYNWSNGSTGASISGLTAGSYSVTVVDAAGCVNNVVASVGNNSGTLSATISAIDATCLASNGSASANATLGTTPYNYVWSNNATDANLTGLAAGTYDLTVTDADGCIATSSTTIAATAGNLTASTSVTDASAFGVNDGAIDLTVNGGTAPFSFAWSNAATTEDISGLASGNYVVTITDANGCTSTQTATVSQPTAVDMNAIGNVNIEMFPNPAEIQTVVSIQLTESNDVRIRLVNNLGQVLQSAEYSNVKTVQHNLNVRDLPAAFYMVEIMSEGKVYTERLVVTRK